MGVNLILLPKRHAQPHLGRAKITASYLTKCISRLGDIHIAKHVTKKIPRKTKMFYGKQSATNNSFEFSDQQQMCNVQKFPVKRISHFIF